MTRNEKSFHLWIEQGKQAAMQRRNRGQHVGKCAKGWNVKRPKLEGLDALEAYYHQWRKDIHYNAFLAVEFALFGHEWEGIEI
jgi:hypothetical protein